MGTVSLRIGGRQHRIACRDGEEAHLERLGARLDAHAAAAEAASGGSTERAMLLIALMLADELHEAEAAPPPLPPTPEPEPEPALPVADDRLDAIADRLEALANALERRRPAP